MFRSEQSREQFKTPETRAQEMRGAQEKNLQGVKSKGPEWMKKIGFALLSTFLVQGVFPREAKADKVDVEIQKTINILAEQSGQPSPLELVRIGDQFTNLGNLSPNTPEDKAAALIPKDKPLSTPGVGITHEFAPGVKLRTSVIPSAKEQGGYALLTINTDFLK